jgi:7-cyano-7-deazaguanine synthase
MRTALLLSGGMDSTALAWAMRPVLAITINYGQLPAQAEIRASRQVCKELEIPHRTLVFDAKALGSGDLAGSPPHPNAPASDWWPFRNQLLLTLAGAAALQADCEQLAIGTVSTDATHQDGSVEFVAQISALMSSQEGALKVVAPAHLITTVDLIREARVPMEILAWSHSCHKANEPCCACRGCFKHWEVLEALGEGENALR